MYSQLEESRAPNRVLNNAQAALRRNRRRSRKVGEERHVIVGRIKTRMVENVECVEVKAQTNALCDRKLLCQTRVKAYLERTAEKIAAGAPVERLVKIATT